MALVKIEEVYLYTCDTDNPVDTYLLLAWLHQNKVEFTHLNYGDPSQHKLVFDAINTWWRDGEAPLSTFPFLVYTVIDSDIPVLQSKRTYTAGIDNIKENFLDIYKVGR